MAILSEKQLQSMRQHQYITEGSGVLTFFDAWFGSIGQRLPKRLAANAVTIIGLFSVITPCMLTSYYTYIGDLQSSRLTAYFCAFGFIMWLFCDGTDGKVARLKGLCSPFGELLDHGGDAFALLVASVALASFLRVTESPSGTIAWVISDVVANYASEPYLIYVCGKNKVVSFDFNEIMITFTLISLASAVFGFQVWTNNIFPGLNFQLVYVFYGIKLFVTAELIIGKSREFYNAMKKQNKPLSFAVKPLVPVLVIVLSASIAFFNTSQEFIQSNAILFALCFGFSLVKAHIQLIVAHMTKSDLILHEFTSLFPMLIACGFIFCKTSKMEGNLMIVSLITTMLDATIYFLRLLHELYHALKETLFILEHSKCSNGAKEAS